MTAVVELLHVADDGTAPALVGASVQLLAAIRSYLDAGGDPEQAEVTLRSTALMAAGVIEKAKRIRRRVHAMMPTQNETKI